MPFQVLGRQVDALRGEIDAAIKTVLDSGWYVLGAQVLAFEEEFAVFCGAGHCVSVANGTDGLELALRALGVGPGDEVITAANAGGYTATAAFAIGAKPVFADIDAGTLLIDPAVVKPLITPRTKAIVATHLYGRLSDVDGLRAIAGGVPILEDCAQAHGATANDGRRAGTLGDLATFSFYPTKNLGALGDGGALVTNDAAMAANLRALRQYGWTDSKYRVDLMGGRNSRLDEMQAAILRVKLRHVEAGNTRRRAILTRYATVASDDVMVPHAPAGPETVAHLAVLRSPRRTKVLAAFEKRGIGTSIHYPIADHLQPALKAAPERWHAGNLSQTERACAEIFTVPCYPEMEEREIAAVAEAIAAAGEET